MKTLSWLAALLLVSAAGERTDFDHAVSGKPPGGWSASAAWMVVKDATAPSQPYALAHVPSEATSGAFATAVLDAAECRDGEVSVKFRPGSDGEAKAGLVWRYRDARNYYFVRADAQEQNVAVYRVAGGRPLPLVPRGRAPGQHEVSHYVHADSWSLLKVVFAGRRFSVYYDHRRILRVDDAAFDAGKVGLWTRGSSAARFDNFELVRRR